MKAFWDRTQNFGDKLGPWLIQRITGKPVEFSAGSDSDPVHVSTGSILNVSVNGSVVWGAGFARCTDPVVSHSRICAVRGPQSRAKLLAYGIECPNVFGDPAILLPRFLQGSKTKRDCLAVIPHYADYYAVKEAYGALAGVQVVRLKDSVEEVVRQITECSAAISSSLHGMIAAHAYGIPCQWVKFSDKVEGCGFKFHDYFSSGGLPMVNPLDLSSVPVIEESFSSQIPKSMPAINADALWDACPFKP